MRTLSIALTGDVQIATKDIGSQRPHGLHQIMGFVKLDLVHGALQGKVYFDPGHYKNQESTILNDILKEDDFVDWEQCAEPNNLVNLRPKKVNQVLTKRSNLLQQLQSEAAGKPDMALTYHAQSIVEKYLSRG